LELLFGNLQLIVKKNLWEDYDTSGIVRKIKKEKRLEQGIIPTKLYQIMLLCWKEKPEDRPSFQQLSKLLKSINISQSTTPSPSFLTEDASQKKIDERIKYRKNQKYGLLTSISLLFLPTCN